MATLESGAVVEARDVEQLPKAIAEAAGVRLYQVDLEVDHSGQMERIETEEFDPVVGAARPRGPKDW